MRQWERAAPLTVVATGPASLAAAGSVARGVAAAFRSPRAPVSEHTTVATDVGHAPVDGAGDPTDGEDEPPFILKEDAAVGVPRVELCDLDRQRLLY